MKGKFSSVYSICLVPSLSQSIFMKCQPAVNLQINNRYAKLACGDSIK